LIQTVRTRVKICGCTSIEDVALAVAAGADAVGVILAERSERRVSIERFRDIAQSVPALTTLVAVFVDPPASLVDEVLHAGAIPQFHGDESAEACEAVAAGPYLKAFHVDAGRAHEPDDFAQRARAFAHATWMFDTAGDDGRSGGTGRTFAWELARKLAGDRRFVVSGGLTPENVRDCVRTARPYAVDVRSGVETNGMKDPEKIRAFVRAVRAADVDSDGL
jgi:phosphoribosylanthranilate isomerase